MSQFLLPGNSLSPVLSEDAFLDTGDLLSADVFLTVAFSGWILYVWASHQNWQRIDKKLLIFLRKKPFTYFSPYRGKRNHYKHWDF